MKKKYLYFFGLLFMAAGCVSTQGRTDLTPSAPDIPARYSLPSTDEKRTPQTEGAIYNEQALDLYQDTRARNIGDIVLVKIVETSSGKKKASTTTERDSSLTGGLKSFFGIPDYLSNHNPNYTPSLTNMETSLKNKFESTGETKRDSNITATISARVIDVTMDGNLVIRGFQEVRLNNESQHIILSGIVRPEDIAKDNSILSTHVADARLEYGGTGVLADKQQPGWLARGLDVIWPF